MVEDIGSCMVKFSRCCAPVPGDDIIGFITKGYGVSVHRQRLPERKAGARDPVAGGALGARDVGASPPDATSYRRPLSWRRTDRDGHDARYCNGAHRACACVSTEMNGAQRSRRCQCLIDDDVRGALTLTELESICARLRGISGVRQIRRGIN